MISFCIGLLILAVGYLFYSKYITSQFAPDDRDTPSKANFDGVDFVPLSKPKNSLIHLLNIAGIGPILGAVQGILFGPIAFILIPLGCIFMGGVHDYFAGMMSVRNNGSQITGLIKKYLGHKTFNIFLIIVGVMLLLLSAVFVFTSGDLIAERFLNQTDFNLHNKTMVITYLCIALYYIIATMFPIDKIIGKLYPYMCALLLIGTGLISLGFIIHGIDLSEINFKTLNVHPNSIHILPMFFMTVSCGLLSGFHATQATIVSRTLKSEYDGKIVFYGMMCVESLIAMIWAAGAMHVYHHNLVPQNIIGTANVVNIIADTYVPKFLTFIITLAVVVLPITSGDTALRGLRIIIAEALNYSQNNIKNRLVVIIPISFAMLSLIGWAKGDNGSFGMIWRYFTFFNQLIAIPTFIYSTIYLYKNNKNYLITLIPALFYIFITTSYILNSNIGLNLDINISKSIGLVVSIISCVLIIKYCKNFKEKEC